MILAKTPGASVRGMRASRRTILTWENAMIRKRISLGSCLLALAVMFVSGCVVAPREGYYDRPHHRWYHNHAWVVCADNDEHCR